MWHAFADTRGLRPAPDRRWTDPITRERAREKRESERERESLLGKIIHVDFQAKTNVEP